MSIFEHYDALIFDLDGTLADTMPLHLKAWELTAQQFGFAFDRDYFYTLGGIPTRETLEIIAQKQNSPLDIDSAGAYKTEKYLSIRDDLGVIAETRDLVFKNSGRLPIGVATGSSRDEALFTLDKIGLTQFIDTLISSDDVLNPKPAADTFAKVAELLKIDPAKCLAFEDTKIGYQSATAAGMHCLMVIDGVIQGLTELTDQLALEKQV
ncbi:MAG: beta-phosphoglucomutase family hydrolase [Psychromonas sp.]|jgi:beta-phosphoglucomutase family hydrolase|uniref:HAD family hydrolase n=1 Tax=Psychromonas sp. TaxID=1884585 RepID=UPI0039E44191